MEPPHFTYLSGIITSLPWGGHVITLFQDQATWHSHLPNMHAILYDSTHSVKK